MVVTSSLNKKELDGLARVRLARMLMLISEIFALVRRGERLEFSPHRRKETYVSSA